MKRNPACSEQTFHLCHLPGCTEKGRGNKTALHFLFSAVICQVLSSLGFFNCTWRSQPQRGHATRATWTWPYLRTMPTAGSALIPPPKTRAGLLFPHLKPGSVSMTGARLCKQTRRDVGREWGLPHALLKESPSLSGINTLATLSWGTQDTADHENTPPRLQLQS